MFGQNPPVIDFADEGTLPGWVNAAKALADDASVRILETNPLQPGEFTLRPFVRGEFFPSPEDATTLLICIVLLGFDEYVIFGLNEEGLNALAEKNQLVVPPSVMSMATEHGLVIHPHVKQGSKADYN